MTTEFAGSFTADSSEKGRGRRVYIQYRRKSHIDCNCSLHSDARPTRPTLHDTTVRQTPNVETLCNETDSTNIPLLEVVDRKIKLSEVELRALSTGSGIAAHRSGR